MFRKGTQIVQEFLHSVFSWLARKEWLQKLIPPSLMWMVFTIGALVGHPGIFLVIGMFLVELLEGLGNVYRVLSLAQHEDTKMQREIRRKAVWRELLPRSIALLLETMVIALAVFFLRLAW